jgi:hypothetical protein
VCGNNVVEFGEQCDGTSTAACSQPGQTCGVPATPNECTCTPPFCGDGFIGATEQCDPGGPGNVPPADDLACPGQCNTLTCQCPVPVCGNQVLEGAEVCELPATGCGPLQVCVACMQCLP